MPLTEWAKKTMIDWWLDERPKELSPAQRFLATQKELCDAGYDIMAAKNHDYGATDDPFANFRKHGEEGILTRLSDKFSRIETLTTKEAKVKSESLKETIIDAINYLCILYAYISWGKAMKFVSTKKYSWSKSKPIVAMDSSQIGVHHHLTSSVDPLYDYAKRQIVNGADLSYGDPVDMNALCHFDRPVKVDAGDCVRVEGYSFKAPKTGVVTGLQFTPTGEERLRELFGESKPKKIHCIEKQSSGGWIVVYKTGDAKFVDTTDELSDYECRWVADNWRNFFNETRNESGSNVG